MLAAIPAVINIICRQTPLRQKHRIAEAMKCAALTVAVRSRGRGGALGSGRAAGHRG